MISPLGNIKRQPSCPVRSDSEWSSLGLASVSGSSQDQARVSHDESKNTAKSASFPGVWNMLKHVSLTSSAMQTFCIQLPRNVHSLEMRYHCFHIILPNKNTPTHTILWCQIPKYYYPSYNITIITIMTCEH